MKSYTIHFPACRTIPVIISVTNEDKRRKRKRESEKRLKITAHSEITNRNKG